MDNIQNIYEELISSISYTNKDFRTIYPELLELARKLGKWDPTRSNESDPGVVLIKLMALIADKNNYNIDKNVLETFPLSVTQDSNARQLYDLLGYNMGWYKSATMDIGFKLKEAVEETVELPMLTTQVSDSTGSITYTLLENVYLSNINEEKYVKAIEGVVYKYNINGTEIISINNMDADLRIYFDETQISENGIFIWDGFTAANMSINEIWQKVDNLASYPAKSRIFKFGVLPNSNKCYIQFPEDAASLIGNGLTIWYTVGNGELGNISTNVIDSWNSDNASSTGETTINNNIQIIQNNAASNGRDPETIENAYKNYKKTIGTFNTLITKRDYENFIYNIEDAFGQPLVSNIIVSDRTDDLNNTYKIQSWQPGLDQTKTIVKTHNVEIETPTGTGTITEPNLNAYNIVMYLFRNEDVADKQTYNNTFKPEKDASVLLDINSVIDSVKAVNHDIFTPTLSTTFTYNNKLTLKGTLVTFNKVTRNEATEIEQNVLNALYREYNSRNVDIGLQIDYDKLIKVIENADKRIKYLVLNNNYNEMYKTDYGTTKQTKLTDADKNEIVAKTALAGKISLFKFDDDFMYDFGQQDSEPIGTVNNPIENITTWAEITIPDNTSEYEVKENEVVQVYYENLITVREFGSFVKYTATLDETIEPNETRELADGETITITDGVNKPYVLQKGTIIESSVVLNDGDIDKSLTSGQRILEKAKNSTTLRENTPYYFILNNAENRLQLNTANDRKYILQENEYFIYSSPSSTDLIVLGSGTLLSTEIDFDKTCERVDVNTLSNRNTVSWNKIPIGVGNPKLTTTELKIYSFGQGVKLNFDGTSTVALSDSESNANKAIKLTPTEKEELQYKDVDANDFVKFEIMPSTIDFYIHSRLNIYASGNVPQKLEDNQWFKIKQVDLSTTTKITDSYVLFNTNVVLPGGNQIDTKLTNIYGETDYMLQAYNYKIASGYTLTRNSTGYITLTGEQNEHNLPFTFTNQADLQNSWLIPLYISKTDDSTINVTTSDNTALNIFNTATPSSDMQNGAYILQIPLGSDYTGLKIKIVSGNEEDIVIIGNITKLSGYNEDEIKDINYDLVANATDVLTNIRNLDKNNEYNWTTQITDNNKVLQPVSPESFWNINHVVNRFTIPQLNFDTTVIRVNQSSIS